MSAKQHGAPCLYSLVLKQPGVLLRAGTASVSMIKLPLSRFVTDSRRPEACTRGRSRHTRCTVQATRASAQSWVCSHPTDSAGQPARWLTSDVRQVMCPTLPTFCVLLEGRCFPVCFSQHTSLPCSAGVAITRFHSPRKSNHHEKERRRTRRIQQNRLDRVRQSAYRKMSVICTTHAGVDAVLHAWRATSLRNRSNKRHQSGSG